MNIESFRQHKNPHNDCTLVLNFIRDYMLYDSRYAFFFGCKQSQFKFYMQPIKEYSAVNNNTTRHSQKKKRFFFIGGTRLQGNL